MTEKVDGNTNHLFVFRRNRGRRGDEGDGNPLIFALKGMRGYHISDNCRQKFLNRAEEIVKKNAQKCHADLIMSVPSGHGFGYEFSNLLSDWLNIAPLSSSFIEKRTAGEVLTTAKKRPPTIENKEIKRDYGHYLNVLSKMNAEQKVSMKDAPTKTRKYFDLLKFSGDAPDLAGKNILVVDDLMSSGSTMRCMIELLRGRGACARTSICFLSEL